MKSPGRLINSFFAISLFLASFRAPFPCESAAFPPETETAAETEASVSAFPAAQNAVQLPPSAVSPEGVLFENKSEENVQTFKVPGVGLPIEESDQVTRAARLRAFCASKKALFNFISFLKSFNCKRVSFLSGFCTGGVLQRGVCAARAAAAAAKLESGIIFYSFSFFLNYFSTFSGSFCVYQQCGHGKPQSRRFAGPVGGAGGPPWRVESAGLKGLFFPFLQIKCSFLQIKCLFLQIK